MRGLTQQRLHELLDYAPQTGTFVWRVSRGVNQCKGKTAGCLGRSGYIQVCLDGQQYRAHRLAWLHVHGRWPDGPLDHIDGCRSNNAIANLRECSVSENAHNTNPQRKLLGVSWHKQNQCWYARIAVRGQRRHLGYFETAEEACAAYLATKAELHPFWATGRGSQ